MHHVSDRKPIRILLTAGAALALAPSIVLWAWNSALPEIFGMPAIDYRNALGLTILALALGAVLGASMFRRSSALRTRPEGGDKGREQ